MPPTRLSSWRDVTLDSAFRPASNSLNMLRLIFASTVAVVHALAVYTGSQPTIGSSTVGALAVDGFFVLSGFLVTRSFLSLGSAARYAWHRAVRILPAFYLVLVGTVILVAPLLALLEGRDPLSVFTREPTAQGYLLDNGLLFIREFAVAGLPASGPAQGVVNGSLWTLYFEALCYVGVAVLGRLGALRRRGWVVVAFVVASLVLTAQTAGWAADVGEHYARFALMFLVGVLGWLYRQHVPITRSWALAASTLLLASLLALPDYRMLGAVPFGYLCLWLAVSTPRLRGGPRDDLSYGMYVFHWPVEVLLAAALGYGLPSPVFSLVAVTLTAGLALLSWRLVEQPALSLKGMPVPSWVPLRREVPRR